MRLKDFCWDNTSVTRDNSIFSGPQMHLVVALKQQTQKSPLWHSHMHNNGGTIHLIRAGPVLQ